MKEKNDSSMRKQSLRALLSLALVGVVAVAAIWLAYDGGAASESRGGYTIINTGIKGGGCWYDDTRIVLLRGHQDLNTHTFVAEGMFYLDVRRPQELKPIDLTPIEPVVWRKMYRMKCADRAVLFSAENKIFKVEIGKRPELIAERQNAPIYPDYVNEESKYVVGMRKQLGSSDSGVSSPTEIAMRECQLNYLKPDYKVLCWHANIAALPWSLPQFVLGEYRWSETVRMKGEDGQEKRVPNPEPPLKRADGTELKHGYLLRNLENKIVQQIPMEQHNYKFWHIQMKPHPLGQYLYAMCTKEGDHEPRFVAFGRVCRFKLDGRNQEWEEVVSVQQTPKDFFDVQDLDVNAVGDVVVIDRGHRLNQSLWKYSAGTHKVELVTRAPVDLRAPLLSPDGQWISFMLRNELFLAQAKGAKP